MGKDPDRNGAFGRPGIPPRWTHAAKDGVGTAYASSSRLWFTVWNGVVTEVYYPTVDRPQLRDLQFLITDGESFFHEEKRHLRSATERLSHHVLGYRITNSDPEGRYSIVKEVLSDPHLPCLLVNTTLSGEDPFLKRLRLYALCAPHLGMGGWGNNGYVMDIAGRKILAAEKDGVWLALAATVPFSRLSCGYVGHSDGWTDLAVDYRMDWEFERALDGNIALTGELDLGDRREFTLGLAFGDGLHDAATTLLESLVIPFGEQRERYADQWNRSCRRLLPLEKSAYDGGDLYHGSYSLLLTHEDKTFPGAFIASLSIPWGESKGDDDRGGYHLVWTRDMVNTATGLLAAGNTESPLRALIYLAVSQHADGGFSQNFWIDGEPYWDGGIYSNTPIEAVLDDKPRRDSLIFAVNVWHQTGPEPTSIWQVMGRQKDIQYASRADSHIVRQKQIHRLRHVIRELHKQLPQSRQNDDKVKELASWGCGTTMHVAHLLAPRVDGEDHTKDIDFTSTGVRARWQAGYADTLRMIDRKPWTKPVDPMDGVVVHQAA